MTTAIDRIRSKNKSVAKNSPEKTSANPFTKNLPTMTDSNTPTLADTSRDSATSLPSPIPCPICDCPAIWSSIYEPQTFRCCVCDPPPGGNDAWHFQRGGWGFVARRLWIVVYADRPEWESLPRTDWNEELRLMRER